MSRLTARGPIAALAALTAASAGGCSDRVVEKGLYVWCNGAADGLYYENPLAGVKDRFSLCLGPEHWSESGGETDDIDIDEWTNDTDDIDTLRRMCVQHCLNSSSDGFGNCQQSPGVQWQIENYQQIFVPDPLMLIRDPAFLYCPLPKSRLAPAPWKTVVIPPGTSPTWPSSGKNISLACHDFETCADAFTTPIGVGLYYDDTDTRWGAGMAGADHCFSTSVAGRSSLTITLDDPTSNTASSDLEDGQIEYSAPACGEAECPFYLGNLSAANASSTWRLHSDDLDDDVAITDVTISLRRPTLGVWNTATGEFYIGEERIDLYVTGTLQIGQGSPMPETHAVTNTAAIFGQIGPDGEVEILDLFVGDGEFGLEVSLDYDTPVGRPPTPDPTR